MTKLQELLLQGGSRYGTKYIVHKKEEKVQEASGICIMTAHGWRAFKSNDTNKTVLFEDDGRYRDGFIERDGCMWSHSTWAAYQELHRVRVEMTAKRINIRGHDRMKIPALNTAGRFDKWGVKVMS